MSMSVSGAGTAAASQIWSGASAPASPTQKMSNLFDAIDTSGSGTITKDQFEQAFQTMNPPGNFQSAGADAVWNKLDPNGTGIVSKQDFVSDMTTMMKELRGHHHHGGGASSAAGAQALMQNTSFLTELGSANAASNATTNSTGSATSTPGSLLNLMA